MDPATTPQIRNVALVGHSGCGKTTLAEGLLRRAGVIARAGRVEDGTTVCDHEPEEIARGISLALGIARLTWPAPDGGPFHVTLLDTPGHPDFATEVDAALAVADLALVVVSAVDGVQAGTEILWQRCAELGLPRAVVVTKEDKAHASFDACLGQLRAAFGSGVVPVELPLGEEAAFHGLADVLTERGVDYGADGVGREVPVPAAVVAREHALHEALAEEIVAGDDAQLERYLDGDEPSAAELRRTLAREVLDGEQHPVLVASGTTGVGLDRLLAFLAEIAPSPAQRPVRVRLGGHEEPGRAGVADSPAVDLDVAAEPDGEPLVHVFRTVADPFVGQVSLFKVLSGTIRTDTRLLRAAAVSGAPAEERLHGLFRVCGKEHQPAEALVAGEIGGVAKLAGSPTGTLLASRPLDVRLPRRARPAPYAVGLRPVNLADDEKLSSALRRLCGEDPALAVEQVPGAGGSSQTVLRGLGETHVEVALERLARKFGVHVVTEPVQIGYRETVAGAAEAEGKVKKQSGGHGQFAVVRLRVAPLPRGAGFEFVDSVVGGVIPRSYLPAVERGVADALVAGGPHGFPVVDVRVECFDGKHHPVDSSEMAFRTAAAQGLRDAVRAAQPVVLEPVSRVEVTVPGAQQGDVLSDLTARRGRVTSTTALADGRQRIEALVPEAELTRYVMDLRSLTGGRGTFEARPDRHEPLPAHLAHAPAAPTLGRP